MSVFTYSAKFKSDSKNSKLYLYRGEDGKEIICKRHGYVQEEAATYRLINDIPGVARMIEDGKFVHESKDVSDSDCLFLEKYEGDLGKLLGIRSARSRKAGNLGVPFSLEEALPYMVRLLTTLEIMHRRNICHGDIKPCNIFYDKNENVYLADFDLSVAYTKRQMENFSKSKVVYKHGVDLDYVKALSIDYWPGTYAYAPPENFVNSALERIGPKYPVSDIWSLGCVFFEMFSGKMFNVTQFYKSDDGTQLLHKETKICNYDPLCLLGNVTEDMNRKGFEIYDKGWEEKASKLGKDSYPAMTALQCFLVHAVSGKRTSVPEMENLKSLLVGMLDPNFLTRLSAKECLENPLFKEHLHISQAMWEEFNQKNSQ